MNSSYKRKLVENEVMFREYNQRVGNGFSELEAIASEDQQTELLKRIDFNLQFYCECADEKCTDRISLKPSTYEKLHKNRSRFIIAPGHIVDEIEHRVKSTAGYEVVEKNITPPKHADGLNATNLHNS